MISTPANAHDVGENLSYKYGPHIATGVDLKQYDEQQLKEIGLPKSIIKKLKPYLGLSGDEARKFVAQSPLEITLKEAEIIDKLVEAYAEKVLEETYNNAISKGQKKFYDLPQEILEIIASVAFDHGIEFKETPKFFAAITKQDWAEMLNVMLNFSPDSFTQERRNREIKYLLENSKNPIFKQLNKLPFPFPKPVKKPELVQ